MRSLMEPASSGSFHSGLTSEIDSDGDSDMFDSGGDILPTLWAQDDVVVDAD